VRLLRPQARLNEAARRFARRDSWKAGRLYFEKTVRARPRDAQARANLGFFCVKETRFDTKRGLAQFGAAIALDPGCADAYIYKAITLGSLGRAGGAAAALSSAKRCGASASDISFARGSVELESGSGKKGIVHFRRMVQLEKDSTSMILLCQAYIQAGKNKEALKWARRACAADRNDFRARVYAGIALIYLGRLAEARTELKKASKGGGSYLLLRHTLAYLAVLEGDTREAERRLRSALRLDPRYAPSIKLLGDLCADTGRVREARRQYRRALKLFPGHSEVRDALRRLD
jgi:tetratricopeptide (TPR) repeat protein